MKIFNNDEIDRQKWDDCIKKSENGLIYAKSFYLDNICPAWKGLRGDKYEWVLPVTARKKFGISYLYQPTFTQQLGVFALPEVEIPFKEIIKRLKEDFKFWEINWNYATDAISINQHVACRVGTNFILDLSAGYDKISSYYHPYLRKSLKNAKELKLVYNKIEDYKKCIELYRKYYGARMPHVSNIDYNNFTTICSQASGLGMVECREAVDIEGELLASVLLLFDEKRLYNIMNVTTERGRKAEANRFLLDSVIKEFSPKNILFDFEGSDLPGVKAFYKSFGAINQGYYMLKHNALPWPLRLFKK